MKSNVGYWSAKIAGNRSRDAQHIAALNAQDWNVFVIWECQVHDSKQLATLANWIKSLPKHKRRALAVSSKRT